MALVLVIDSQNYHSLANLLRLGSIDVARLFIWGAVFEAPAYLVYQLFRDVQIRPDALVCTVGPKGVGLRRRYFV